MHRTTRRRFLGALAVTGLFPLNGLAQEQKLVRKLKKYLVTQEQDIGSQSIRVSLSTFGKGETAIRHLQTGLGNVNATLFWKNVQLADGIGWRKLAVEHIKQRIAKDKADDGKLSYRSRVAYDPMINIVYDLKPIYRAQKLIGFDAELKNLRVFMLQVLVDRKPLKEAIVKLSDDQGVLAQGKLEIISTDPTDTIGSGQLRGSTNLYTDYASLDQYQKCIFKDERRFVKMLAGDSLPMEVTTLDGRKVASFIMPVAPIRVANQKLTKLAMQAAEELKAGKGRVVPDVEIEDVDCFLTTATCDVLGLPDNCWELRSLRHFRDHHLVNMPGGEQDIATYYEQAPAISQHLLATDRGRRQLRKLYFSTILPCAILTRIGAQQTCRKLYTRMMNRLLT